MIVVVLFRLLSVSYLRRSSRRLAALRLGVLNQLNSMTPVEIRAAHRMNAALLRQTREKMRDQQQNLFKAEA